MVLGGLVVVHISTHARHVRQRLGARQAVFLTALATVAVMTIVLGLLRCQEVAWAKSSHVYAATALVVLAFAHAWERHRSIGCRAQDAIVAEGTSRLLGTSVDTGNRAP